jgi:hypothetical protein
MKRALLVGIDRYETFPSLRGCVNDVKVLAPLLARHDNGDPNFECMERTSAEVSVTRASLLSDLRALLEPKADVALLYFAGHGTGPGDDVVLCCEDGSRHAPGVGLSEVLGLVPRSPVEEIVILLDCCMSGGAGGAPQLGSDVSVLRPGVTIVAASRPDQTAAETADDRGLFSTYLCAALTGGAADVLGRVTVAGLYAYLDESFGAWGQRPMFKANLERLEPLRQCEPAVELALLRRLTDLFTTPEAELALDPSYEPEALPRDPVHEADFGALQSCRAAKLVEPVGAEHLYFAAMKSASCRLTPLGQHYWRLARTGRL